MNSPGDTTDVFIGMHRPTLSTIIEAWKVARNTKFDEWNKRNEGLPHDKWSPCNASFVATGCITNGLDDYFNSDCQIHEAWKNGMFDTPVYASRQEIIDSIGRAKANQE